MKRISDEVTNRHPEHQVALSALREMEECFDPRDPNLHIHRLATLPVQALNKLLGLDAYYRMIQLVPGDILEFGVHWGSGLATWINLRSIYEPFNASRVIHGFDTFAGFPAPHENDGNEVVAGMYSTTSGYEESLEKMLSLHESMTPQAHLRKFWLHKGDASASFRKLLDDRPHTLIALAYFDLDLYEPTKELLALVVPRLTRGSVLVFDELNCAAFPGETLALLEVLGLSRLALKRLPNTQYGAYAVWEG